MYKVLREVKDSQLVKEAFYPHGIEGLGHVEEQRACQPPLVQPHFHAGNVHIWVVPSCQVVDLLILRNRIFRQRIVQICVMPSCKGVN